jgi:pyroglutamyl-peptidase
MSIAPSQVKPSGQKFRSAVNGKRRELYCLITGFDAFAGDQFNPSQAIVESLPESLDLPGQDAVIQLAGLVLPTCGNKAWKKLKKSLEKLPRNSQSVVILTGLAAIRPNISIERFALNIRDYRIKDNAGHMINGKDIDRNGPDALRTQINLEGVIKQVRRKGLTADISNYCGTFICNEIYYQGLRFQKERQLPHALLFVHVPLPAQYGKRLRQKGTAQALKRSSGKANQLLAMQEAVIEIARYLCAQAVSAT